MLESGLGNTDSVPCMMHIPEVIDNRIYFLNIHKDIFLIKIFWKSEPEKEKYVEKYN